MVAGDIQADTVYEDDELLAFNDINPQAPTHILIIPKIHIATLNDLQPEQGELIGKLFITASGIARDRGFAEEGYRTLINCNESAGQTVFHVHLHLLAGRRFGWPPG
jgi:histidine triad (HIT) family protein